MERSPSPVRGIGPLTAAEAVTISLDTAIISLDPATGGELWRGVAQDEMTWTSPGRGVLLITRLNGGQATVEARDPRTGARRWESAALDPSVTPAATDGRPLWTDSGSRVNNSRDSDWHRLTAACYLAASSGSSKTRHARPLPG
jgi:hypothetical protein